MRARIAFLFGIVLLAQPGITSETRAIAGQETAAVPLTAEPHHHLAFQNSAVKIFRVEVPAHESTMLHQHDHDYVYVTIGDATITSAQPGKPEEHLQLADGTASFSRGGFAHVARNDGDTPFRNDTIELLRPQGALHNLCVQVIANEPASCSARPPAGAKAANYTVWPEFESDQTRVILTRISPQKQMELQDADHEILLVAVDEIGLAPIAGKGMERQLRPGDFLWLGKAAARRLVKNNTDKAAMFITLQMKPGAESDKGGKQGPIQGPPLKPSESRFGMR